MKGILIGMALLALAAGCGLRPSARARVAVGEIGLGGGRAGTLTNTGGLPLHHVAVFVEADLPDSPQVRGQFYNPPAYAPDLNPGESHSFVAAIPPAGVRNAHVEADGPDGHPFAVPFTLEVAGPKIDPDRH
jgi:hypothetical protein